jgi:hypothetical protein
VLGCARRVHEAVGPGQADSVYHRALCREFMRERILFSSRTGPRGRCGLTVCGRLGAGIQRDGRIDLDLLADDRLDPERVAAARGLLADGGGAMAMVMSFGGADLRVERIGPASARPDAAEA